MAASAGIMIAGAMVKAYSATEEARAAAQAAGRNAQVAEMNAGLVRDQAREEARRSRIIGNKFTGQARANIGASGIQTGGSALDVLSESAMNAELDAQTIKQAGEHKAFGFESDAWLDRKRRGNMLQAGYMRASGELLSGAGQAYAMDSRSERLKRDS